MKFDNEKKTTTHIGGAMVAANVCRKLKQNVAKYDQSNWFNGIVGKVSIMKIFEKSTFLHYFQHSEPIDALAETTFLILSHRNIIKIYYK